ncbi:hypothetical protein GCM10017691_42980 [Pseudonocardia petroleophila]|uniref:DUF3105 domain-containing protein n=1 Tax=Pseudonocardia petroleophila TaxID=37331 RepID=A0A7G7MB65_9PSEU|nr:DUF3105 domain-containing protein [Pseudonocardia petroleophila]QNG50026.1 DUF3105 domain-containing protein [Pseudonocardia petroleophila]
MSRPSDPPRSPEDDPPASGWSRYGGPLILVLAAVSFGSVAVGTLIPSDAERELASFTPSAEQPDPSTGIPGIVIGPGPGDPPVSGAVGPTAAACDGVAHPDPIPDAEALGAMERGAVWITYDPARTAPGTVQALAANRVTDGDDLLMSPYPGLDAPISLQAWNHRLALDSPDDPRFEQFIRALAANPATAPGTATGCAP